MCYYLINKKTSLSKRGIHTLSRTFVRLFMCSCIECEFWPKYVRLSCTYTRSHTHTERWNEWGARERSKERPQQKLSCYRGYDLNGNMARLVWCFMLYYWCVYRKLQHTHTIIETAMWRWRRRRRQRRRYISDFINAMQNKTLW